MHAENNVYLAIISDLLVQLKDCEGRKTKFNPVHKVQFELFSERTPNGDLKAIACRFCTVFSREPHGGIKKSLRRKQNYRKYVGAFRPVKNRQHFIIISKKRWAEYQQIEPVFRP